LEKKVKKNWLIMAVIGLLFICTILAPGCTTKQETSVIRFGHFGVNNNMDLIVADQLGLFTKHGVQVELSKMGTGDIVPALVGGHLDGGLGAAAYVLQSIKEGVNVKLVATAAKWERPQQLPYIVVLTESPVQNIKDLDGKTISAGQKGSCTWYHIKTIEMENKMQFSQYIEAPAASQYTPMLFAKTVDSTVMFGTQRLIQYKDKVRSITPLSGEAIIGCTSSFMWFHTDYLDKNSGTVKGFIDALQEARNYIKEKPEDSIALFVKFSGGKLEDQISYYKQGMLWDFPKEMLVEVWQMKNAQDLILKMGILKEPLDINKYVDTRFAKPVWEMPPHELDWLPKTTAAVGSPLFSSNTSVEDLLCGCE
jgi:ABC-type nitrate/sulfonate/bicarbonate transport system substrate-binding protein